MVFDPYISCVEEIVCLSRKSQVQNCQAGLPPHRPWEMRDSLA